MGTGRKTPVKPVWDLARIELETAVFVSGRISKERVNYARTCLREVHDDSKFSRDFIGAGISGRESEGSVAPSQRASRASLAW